MLLAAFLGFGILVLLALPVLVVALVVNVLEDRELDAVARATLGGPPLGPPR